MGEPYATCPPTHAEVGTPTTMTNFRIPRQADVSSNTPKALTMRHQRSATWCPIHKNVRHDLRDCLVIRCLENKVERYQAARTTRFYPKPPAGQNGTLRTERSLVGALSSSSATDLARIARPAQYLNSLNQILRETPYDLVLAPDVEEWAHRLQEFATSIRIALAQAATQTREDPPRQYGDASITEIAPQTEDETSGSQGLSELATTEKNDDKE
uniref:Uncharacterized protein n=1 Tax=Leersia perrieri TaxID=77586 RepID=A0A0D9WXZ5_9ORYZ